MLKIHVMLSLLALTSCTASAPDTPPAVLSQPLDATVQQQAETQQLAALRNNSKIKVGRGGTLVLQIGGAGNVASPQQTDNRKAGQRQGTAAVGDGTTASNASKREAGMPWQMYLLVAALGAAGWERLSSKVPLGWLWWRARVS